MGSNHIRYLNLGSHVRLTTDIPLSYVLNSRAFVPNEPMYLVFSYGPPMEAPLAATAADFLDKTRKYWLQWVKTTSIAPIFQEAIIRSALVLKLHQFEDTGAIIASGTASLPEFPQSGRTWDYRYCWLRDTYGQGAGRRSGSPRPWLMRPCSRRPPPWSVEAKRRSRLATTWLDRSTPRRSAWTIWTPAPFS
ncbi:MAG: glycoside hydrolase family 15 protein [Planctomycetota bacterium]